MPSLSEMVSALIALLMALVLHLFGAHENRATDQSPPPATQNADRSAVSPAPSDDNGDKSDGDSDRTAPDSHN